MWQLRSSSTTSPGRSSVISIALFDVLVPFVMKHVVALPKISEARRCASTSGAGPSGEERSPRRSTETERSVRKVMSPKSSWKPRRKGELSNALPPLWPGVCQLVPARLQTYSRSAVQKRGDQNERNARWSFSRLRSGWRKISAGRALQRRVGAGGSASPGLVRTTFGIAGK